MRTTISPAFRRSVEAQETDDVFLVLATISHKNLSDPIRVINDSVDYQYGGNIYIGCPFEIYLLSDGEGRPQSKVSIQNVDRAVGDVVAGMEESPRIKLEVISLSQFSADVDDTVGTNGARTEIGTAHVEYLADQLRLAKVSVDSMMVTGDIVSWDFSQEPWPVYRATKNRLPGLYR